MPDPILYIHQSTCISSQESFGEQNLDVLREPIDNKLLAIEPKYENIPPGMLRRMGKAVRMGVGSALPLIREANGSINGIIIGTANGGMEDCIKFLNQIVHYEEGQLTPGNFVQSTPNAIAAQLGLLSKNKGYNITHVHRGLSFENALIDAAMMLSENPGHQYLLGAVDEISAYNYNIDLLGGWYKREDLRGKNLYDQDTPGSIVGEGATMFLVNNQQKNATAAVRAISTLHTSDVDAVQQRLKEFLNSYLPPGEKVDILLSGENGDSRDKAFFDACELCVDADTIIARYKHMFGEFATASAIACWMAIQIMKTQEIPEHMIKKSTNIRHYNRVLIYNNHKHVQHSFILLEIP